MVERAVSIQQIASLMDGSSEAAIVTDARGVIEYVNPAFESMTGYRREEAVGQTASILKSGTLPQQFYRSLWDTLLAGREFRGVLVNRRRDGEIFYEEAIIRPLFDGDGRIAHFLSCGHDVSQRLEAVERLKFQALHDALTELPNRTLFLGRLRQALSMARRGGDAFAIVLADLDGFKSINDTVGHEAGDAVLRTAALRLRSCVRDVDTVARLGGDEFGVLVRGVSGAAALVHVMRKIADAFAAPIPLRDALVARLTISLGASEFPADGTEGETLMRAADRAMYRAKRAGGNGACMAGGAEQRFCATPAGETPPAGADGERLLELLEHNVPLQRRVIRAGDVLFRTGDPFRDVFVIRCGVCKLVNVAADGRGQLASLLFKDDWAGLDGIATARYQCDAVAVDAGKVWVVRYADLLQAGARSPALLQMLHGAMSREITRGREASLAHNTLSADARVADFLHRLADSLAGSGMRTDAIRLRVSRAEIGSHLGLAHESVSRAISRLVRERVIHFGETSRRELHIPDLGALRDFVRRQLS